MSAASSSSVHASSNHQGWITPEEQLARLSLPIAREVAWVTKELIPDIANIIAKYTVDESVTNWYKALSRLQALPKKIPPLPRNIHQIMDGKCPIYGDEIQPDGTYLKIKDTHFLALIPEEFGTLNKLEEKILIPYGEQEYPEGENPLQFRYFWDDARRQHADVPFAPTHWVLMTNTVLPGSRNKSWAEQVELVDALSRKALKPYEAPTLQQSFTAIVTDMVATGETCYQAGNARNQIVDTYTRVKETTLDLHLAVGGSAPSGVFVGNGYVYDYGGIGVAALRKF